MRRAWAAHWFAAMRASRRVVGGAEASFGTPPVGRLRRHSAERLWEWQAQDWRASPARLCGTQARDLLGKPHHRPFWSSIRRSDGMSS